MPDIRQLYPPRSDDDRRQVHDFAKSAPFARDSWHHLKWLYKQAEAARDIPMLAILLRRIDRAPMPWSLFGEPGDIHELRFDQQGLTAIAASGDRIALADGHHLFLCEGRDHPALVARFEFPASRVLGWHGEYLITTLGDRGIQVVDFADFAKPARIGELLLDCEFATFLDSCDDYVYLNAGSQLIILDLAEPALPRCLFQEIVTRPLDSGQLAAYRHTVYIGGRGGCRILDCRKPRRPKQVTALHSAGIFGSCPRIIRDHLVWAYEVYDLSIPTHPKRQKEPPQLTADRQYILAPQGLRVAAGNHPTPETISYMKRRGRRLLRSLAKEAPAQFANLASRLLRSIDRDWELPTQWIAADLLYGGGKRQRQARHGRGPVSLEGPAPAHAELRSPQAWRESPVAALLVLVAPNAPWQLREAMVRTFANSAHLPALLLDDEVMTRDERLHLVRQLFDAPSARLVHLACRIVGDLELDETLQAVAWFFAGREPEQGNSPKFAKALCTCIGRHPTPSASRVRRAAERLRRDQIVGAELLPGIAGLLRSPHPEVVALAYVGVRSMPAKHFFELALQLSQLPDDDRDAALAAMLSMAAGVRLRKRWFMPLISADSAWIRGAGWALAEVAQVEDRMLVQLWSDLLSNYESEPVAETACTSAAALRIVAGMWDELGGANRVVCMLLKLAPNTLECLKALEGVASQITLTEVGVRELTSQRGDWCRSVGWRVLVASATRPRLIVQRIERLFVSGDELVSVFREPSVLGFLRDQEEGDYLQRLLRERPHDLAQLPDAAVLSILGALPPSAYVELAGICDATAWEPLAARGLDALAKHWVEMDFWRALEADMSSRAIERLLLDPRYSARLRKLKSDEALHLSAPDFEPTLMAWIADREARFLANSAILRRAATHRLPQVRAWALARVGQMNLPFALALMECGLPESVAIAARWFDALTAGTDAESAAIFALLDSPDAEVQAFARGFLQARIGTTPETLAKLGEHPAPRMREFVARQLAENPEAAAACTDFDRHVMRTRRRGRRAKELVKARVADTGLDPAVLAELARGRSSRDAEWAWQQLAQLAASGVEIEGLEQVGESGI